MCEPISMSLAVGSLKAAQSYMGIQAANEQAEAQAEAANAAALADYKALEAKQGEIKDSYALEKFERKRQGLRERATARVSAGESGLAGNSIYRQIINSKVQEMYDIAIVGKNEENNLKQVSREAGKVSATNKGRTNQAKAGTTTGLASGLQIGAAGASGAFKGYSIGNALSSSSSSAAATSRSKSYVPHRRDGLR